MALAGLAAWLLVLLGAAEIVRIRRERAAEAARIQEEEALRRASEERLRIARELHDALGHHLSLISVQSGVALHVNEELPEQARSSLSAIKQASKEALDRAPIGARHPAPGGRAGPAVADLDALARLDDLVSQAARRRARGADRGRRATSRPLPFGVDVAAFRIVQEALTNVTRHAGAATATVRARVRRARPDRPGRRRRARAVAEATSAGSRQGHRRHAGTRRRARRRARGRSAAGGRVPGPGAAAAGRRRR